MTDERKLKRLAAGAVKSRTMRFAALLPAIGAALTAAESNLHLLRDTLGPSSYVVLSSLVAGAIAYLRVITDKPLDNRQTKADCGTRSL